MQIYSEKIANGEEKNKSILFGEGTDTDKLNVTAKACAGRQGTVVKISVLGKGLICTGINKRLRSIKIQLT